MSAHGKDRRYFLKRAGEELETARRSKDPAAAAIHERLAKLYLARAEAIGDEQKE